MDWLMILIILLYFIPFLIAEHRRANTLIVFIINLLLWWTVIGWLVAIILAFWKTNKEKKLDRELKEAIIKQYNK